MRFGGFDANVAWFGTSLPCLLAALSLFPMPCQATMRNVDGAVDFSPFAESDTRRLISLSGTIPLQPASNIIDEAGLLTVKQRTALARKLTLAAENHDLHVYAVILEELPAEGVVPYARKVLSSWRSGRASNLALYVIAGQDDWRNRFFVFPGAGRSASRVTGTATAAATLARSAALANETPAEAFDVCVSVLLERLAEFPATITGFTEKTASPGVDPAPELAPKSTLTPTPPETAMTVAITDRPPDTAPQQSHASPATALSRLARPLSIVAPVAFLLAAAVLYIRRRRRNRAIIFPECDFRYRLGGPYTGGNSARLDFRTKRHRAVPMFR